ncbi:hypothetical protein MMARJ_00070 [Mycobacterium marseillense]|uniref:RNA-binding protein AU-1/Ribonuclease E/G domain-containing protein n=1 Tax=Mycobacterium marseillense TaxID=701042 RepID=A0ABN5ZKP3_9MYCO|nr:hypothetical protein MMARJ_00070 [Mycobacterium marseillense]
MFAVHRIDEQLAKAMDRKVWLPSGGTLVIDRTEAMTVVDVNTGKFTGSGGNLEQTVTKNNLEAAEEIVRQLRLRDIGGIVVIDFIDMVLESNRDLVLRRLTEALARDRTRHQVSEVTSLGLVQLTRKRLGTGLVEAFSTSCPNCGGRGILHTDPVDSAPSNGRKSESGAAGPAQEEQGRGAGGGQGARPLARRAPDVQGDGGRFVDAGRIRRRRIRRGHRGRHRRVRPEEAGAREDVADTDQEDFDDTDEDADDDDSDDDSDDSDDDDSDDDDSDDDDSDDSDDDDDLDDEEDLGDDDEDLELDDDDLDTEDSDDSDDSDGGQGSAAAGQGASAPSRPRRRRAAGRPAGPPIHAD